MVLDNGLGTLQRDFVTFAVTAAWVTLYCVDPPYILTGLSFHHSQLQPLDSCVLFLNLFCCLALDSRSHILFQIGLKVLRMTLWLGTTLRLRMTLWLRITLWLRMTLPPVLIPSSAGLQTWAIMSALCCAGDLTQVFFHCRQMLPAELCLPTPSLDFWIVGPHSLDMCLHAVQRHLGN